jgi:hypothetical protein
MYEEVQDMTRFDGPFGLRVYGESAFSILPVILQSGLPGQQTVYGYTKPSYSTESYRSKEDSALAIYLSTKATLDEQYNTGEPAEHLHPDYMSYKPLNQFRP